MAHNLNPIAVLREAASQTQLGSAAWNTLVHAAIYAEQAMSADARKRRNANRRARHQAMLDCGLVRVVVNGKVFYE